LNLIPDSVTDLADPRSQMWDLLAGFHAFVDVGDLGGRDALVEKSLGATSLEVMHRFR